MDTIMQTETGYIVTPDDPFADVVSVEHTDGSLVCECASGGTDPCQHIELIDNWRLTEGEVGIPSQEQVDFLLKKVGRIEARMNRNEKAARTEVRLIEAWLERQNGKLVKRIRYIMYWCRIWLEDSGMKTAELPHGTLKLRLQQEKLEIKDEDAVLSDGRFIRTIPKKKEIDRKAIRERINATGEIPPGVEWLQQEPKFSWECYEVEVDHE